LKLLEDWLCHPGMEEDYHRNEVMNNEEKFHPEEKLEEVGFVPVGELVETNMSEETAGQHLNNEASKLEPAEEWKTHATGDEDSMGDHIDLPIELCDEKEMQQ
jgi:hypothetical protein